MTPKQRKHFEFVRDEMHGEPEQQKVVWDEKIGGIGFDVPMPNANYKVTATVIPKQNQEPIAWLCQKDNGHFDVLTDQTCKKCFPVYTNDTSEERVAQTRENVHEPEWYHVIDVHGCNRFYHRTEDCPYKIKMPLYTTPQQRKPLTFEQKLKIVSKFQNNELNEYQLIEMVEAAHGIKE